MHPHIFMWVISCGAVQKITGKWLTKISDQAKNYFILQKKKKEDNNNNKCCRNLPQEFIWNVPWLWRVCLEVTTPVMKWLKTRFGLMNISSSWEISPRLTQGFVRNTFWYLKSCLVHISLSYINHFPWGVTCNTLNVLTLSKSLTLMADGIAVFKIFLGRTILWKHEADIWCGVYIWMYTFYIIKLTTQCRISRKSVYFPQNYGSNTLIYLTNLIIAAGL